MIKKGDTLLKIATANGVTLEELMAANPTIKNPNKIAEGQQIIIPTPPSAGADRRVGGAVGGAPRPSCVR